MREPLHSLEHLWLVVISVEGEQRVPSLPLFGLLLPLPLPGGIGERLAIVVLFLYACLPILRNTLLGSAAVGEGGAVVSRTGYSRDRAFVGGRFAGGDGLGSGLGIPMDRRQVNYLGAAALGVGCGVASALTAGLKRLLEREPEVVFETVKRLGKPSLSEAVSQLTGWQVEVDEVALG